MNADLIIIIRGFGRRRSAVEASSNKGGPMDFQTIREENSTTSLVTSLAIVLTTLAAAIGPLFAA